MNRIALLVIFCFTFFSLKAQIQMPDAPAVISLDSAQKLEIYERVEVMPAYPGGTDELMKFISKNLKYPAKARKKGAEGKAVIRFYVDIDGSVKNPEIIKDEVGYGCAEEAIRVINLMPKWKPGNYRGKNVKVYYTLPITFRLA